MKIKISKSQWESIGHKTGWNNSVEDLVMSKKLSTEESDVEFFITRQKGAKKIAKAAKEKGGASILTMWHFEAKDTPYSKVIKAVKDGESIDFYEENFEKLMKQLDIKDMSQKGFQALIGEIEVWGEAICKLKG